MKWKNRITNYNFWISIVSAVLLILQAFHINFDIAYINEIATAVLGLLVVIGIINDPTKSISSISKIEDKKEEQLKEEKLVENIKNNQEIENNQNIPSDVENKTDDGSSEIDIKTVINLISSEIKKSFDAVGISNTKKIEKEETLEEIEEVAEIKEETCYNIVN